VFGYTPRGVRDTFLGEGHVSLGFSNGGSSITRSGCVRYLSVSFNEVDYKEIMKGQSPSYIAILVLMIC
jgi:hypothetical protein